MSKKINKTVVRNFLLRRRSNALGLSIITAASAIITLICALTGFDHTDILVLVTMALVALCLVQMIRSRRFFRTLRKRYHRKKPVEAE